MCFLLFSLISIDFHSSSMVLLCSIRKVHVLFSKSYPFCNENPMGFAHVSCHRQCLPCDFALFFCWFVDSLWKWGSPNHALYIACWKCPIILYTNMFSFSFDGRPASLRAAFAQYIFRKTMRVLWNCRSRQYCFSNDFSIHRASGVPWKLTKV